MSTEIYIKIAQHIKINKKKVLLSDIASLHCVKNDIKKDLENMMVLNIASNEHGMYALTTLKVIELIHHKKNDLVIVNEGEKDFIIEYVPLSEDKIGAGAKPRRMWVEYVKAAFVAIVAFFGS